MLLPMQISPIWLFKKITSILKSGIVFYKSVPSKFNKISQSFNSDVLPSIDNKNSIVSILNDSLPSRGPMPLQFSYKTHYTWCIVSLFMSHRGRDRPSPHRERRKLASCIIHWIALVHVKICAPKDEWIDWRQLFFFC